MRPRLIGDKDRIILQEDVERLLAFLDTAADTGQPPPPHVQRRRDRCDPDAERRKQTWFDFWQTSRIVVRILLQSGLRRAELANLTVSDCDLANKPYQLLVRGGKKRRADEIDPVVIPVGLAGELEAWILDRELEPEHPLIPNQAGYHCSTRWIYELAKAPIREVGLNPKYATHHYRHRYATSLLQSTDGDLLLVQKQLRHRTLQPTSNYLHLAAAEEEMAAAMDGISLDTPARPRKRTASRTRTRRLATQLQLQRDRRRR